MMQLQAIDESRHRLGSLCKRGHDWQGTGMSVRLRHNNVCLVCKRDNYAKLASTDAGKERHRVNCLRASRKRSSTRAGRKKATAYQVKYRRKKLDTDPYFALVNRLRSRLRRALKVKYATSKELGIDYKAIADHLGPCPGDPKEYHVDHKIPLSKFDLTNPTQVRAAFAPDNHQWLPALENIRKGNRLVGGERVNDMREIRTQEIRK